MPGMDLQFAGPSYQHVATTLRSWSIRQPIVGYSTVSSHGAYGMKQLAEPLAPSVHCVPKEPPGFGLRFWRNARIVAVLPIVFCVRAITRLASPGSEEASLHVSLCWILVMFRN